MRTDPSTPCLKNPIDAPVRRVWGCSNVGFNTSLLSPNGDVAQRRATPHFIDGSSWAIQAVCGEEDPGIFIRTTSILRVRNNSPHGPFP